MVQPRARSTAAWCDRLLDAAIVLLASWTVVYHVCVVLRLGTTWAVLLELVTLAVAATLWVVRRSRRPAETAPEPTTYDATPATGSWGRLPLVTVGAAVVAAVGMAVGAPWFLVWVPWLLAAVAGSLWAFGGVRAAPADVVDDAVPESAGRLSTGVVLAWTVGLAVLSVWTLRANPDDLFYVNYSQWVAGHGSFPVRDTLFSDLLYPMANWPPIASYDALVGTVARLLGVHAASVEYIVVPPIATALSVLAMWRLLRTWRVRQVAVVLSVAMVFLLFDGTGSYGTPGNLFVTRLWQGKVILLCVVVPLLLVHALRYVERPTRARIVPVALGGVAAVGLSTTAIFLTPVVALAGMAPLALRSPRRALAGFVAMAAYPLGAGVVTELLGGRSADDFGARRLYRFDASWIGHEIFLTGLLALVAVVSVLVGALLVPHPAARVTTGLLAVSTGLVLVPGATRLSYDVTGLGPTLWRLSWACTVAALVGVAVVHAGTWLRLRVRGRRGDRWAVPVASALALVLLAVFGAPILSSRTGTVLRPPFHWQRSSASRTVVAGILAATKPGDVVLAPDSLSITLAVTSTDVRSVAPRDYYMHYLRHERGFHYDARLKLVHFIDKKIPLDTPGILRDLSVVGVKVACTTLYEPHRYAMLRAAGYTPLLSTASYRCLHRT